MHAASPSNAGSSSGVAGSAAEAGKLSAPAAPLWPPWREGRAEETLEVYASWEASAAGHAWSGFEGR